MALENTNNSPFHYTFGFSQTLVAGTFKTPILTTSFPDQLKGLYCIGGRIGVYPSDPGPNYGYEIALIYFGITEAGVTEHRSTDVLRNPRIDLPRPLGGSKQLSCVTFVRTVQAPTVNTIFQFGIEMIFVQKPETTKYLNSF